MIPLSGLVELIYNHKWGSLSGRPELPRAEEAPENLTTVGSCYYYATHEKTTDFFLKAFVIPFFFFCWNRIDRGERVPGGWKQWVMMLVGTFVISAALTYNSRQCKVN